MTDSLALFAIVLTLYVAVVLFVGVLATRRAARSPEEFFLAGRGLGTLVLFMALFGTNCTAFVLVGVPGRAYHDGIGVFSVNTPIVGLGIPLTFWAIGSPARRMAKRLGALTPAELYARRFGSRVVGVVLFLVFTLYTLPYMVTAVDGAAQTLAKVTGGRVSEVWGGAGVLLVALAYTALGGMRATAWTNVLQGALFMAFMAAAFFYVARSMGGLAEATSQVREVAPERLVMGSTGLFEPRAFVSWSLAISLTVIAFPHMLVRIFAADSEATLKRIARIYPLALIALWVPAVMLGVWGAALFPGLEGRESDGVFSLIAANQLPPWLGAIGFLAVLAAVMSTLDAQLLTLGSMLTRDVLDPYLERRKHRTTDVATGRFFGALLALVVFTLWLTAGESIFATASVAFSGYVTLAPALFCGVRWRRFTREGLIASVAFGNAVYFLALVDAGGSHGLLAGALRPAWLGFLPVVWGFLAAALAAVAVSLATPPNAEQTELAFGKPVGGAGSPATY